MTVVTNQVDVAVLLNWRCCFSDVVVSVLRQQHTKGMITTSWTVPEPRRSPAPSSCCRGSWKMKVNYVKC